MDKEKLKTAADISQGNVEYNDKNNHYDGFIMGAQWLMQQPLSERLTDEEKEKIREEYNLYKDSWNDTELTETTMESFVEIFGTDLFKGC